MNMKRSVPAERAQASEPTGRVLAPSREFGAGGAAPAPPAMAGTAPAHDFANVAVQPGNPAGAAIQRMKDPNKPGGFNWRDLAGRPLEFLGKMINGFAKNPIAKVGGGVAEQVGKNMQSSHSQQHGGWMTNFDPTNLANPNDSENSENFESSDHSENDKLSEIADDVETPKNEWDTDMWK
jgi:hypothetical protein